MFIRNGVFSGKSLMRTIGSLSNSGFKLLAWKHAGFSFNEFYITKKWRKRRYGRNTSGYIMVHHSPFLNSSLLNLLRLCFVSANDKGLITRVQGLKN